MTDSSRPQITDETSLAAILAPIAEAARQAGMFFDAFAVRVYRDGTTGATHVACNHDGGPLGTSCDAWDTITAGLTRRMEGETPQDEYHPDDHRAEEEAN